MSRYTGKVGSNSKAPELIVSNGIIEKARSIVFPSLYGSVIQSVTVDGGLQSSPSIITETGNISLPDKSPIVNSLGVLDYPIDGSDPQLKTYLSKIKVDQYGRVESIDRDSGYTKDYTVYDFTIQPIGGITGSEIRCLAHEYKGLVTISFHGKVFVNSSSPYLQFSGFPSSISPGEGYSNNTTPITFGTKKYVKMEISQNIVKMWSDREGETGFKLGDSIEFDFSVFYIK